MQSRSSDLHHSNAAELNVMAVGWATETHYVFVCLKKTAPNCSAERPALQESEPAVRS